MSVFFIPMKYTRMIRGLQKMGLEIKGGTKHDQVICPTTGKKTRVPRHKNKDLKSEIVKSICNFLLEQSYSEQEIKKALKIKTK